jgi:hypothetical protein
MLASAEIWTGRGCFEAEIWTGEAEILDFLGRCTPGVTGALVGSGNPKGWAYTKWVQAVDGVVDFWLIRYRYLYLTEITYPMLQMHQRHVYNNFDESTDDIDLRRSFPRLVLLSWTRSSETKTVSTDDDASQQGSISADEDVSPAGTFVTVHPLHLELFRSVPFDELSSILLPVSSGSAEVVGIYGTCLGNVEPHHSSSFDIHDINSLVLKKGAGLLPPTDGSVFDIARTGRTLCRAHNLILKFEQSDVNPDTISTIDLVLDFVKVSSKSSVLGIEPRLWIACSLAVLDSYITIVRSLQTTDTPY